MDGEFSVPGYSIIANQAMVMARGLSCSNRTRMCMTDQLYISKQLVHIHSGMLGVILQPSQQIPKHASLHHMHTLIILYVMAAICQRLQYNFRYSDAMSARLRPQNLVLCELRKL